MCLHTDDIEEAVASLQKVGQSDGSAYRKARTAFRGIPRLPVLIRDVPQGTVLFRSRTCDSPNPFTTIPEIAEPPRSVLSNFGRCNTPSQPRFYCSNNRPTSYIELVDDWVESESDSDKVYVTIGRWKLKSPMPTVIVPRPDASDDSPEYDQAHGSPLNSFLRQLKEEVARATKDFFTFLAEKFRQPGDPKTYAISTAYSNIAFQQTDAVAIAYPSIPFGEQGLNYCIKPSFRRVSNLRLTNVLQNELTIMMRPEGEYSFVETNSTTASRIDVEQRKIFW